jgi:multiple sugar transport system substrate-binding protein
MMLAGALVAVGYWLFADTWARHVPGARANRAIRFAHFGGAEDHAFFQGVIDDFHAASPPDRVRQEYVVGLSGHYLTKLRQQILSDTLPDVFLVQLAWFDELSAHLADCGVLLDRPVSAPGVEGDAPRALRSLLDPVGLEAFRADGRQRALPISGGSLVIYLNLDCLEAARRHRGESVPPPSAEWTMAEFHDTARRMTCDFDADGVIDQFGFWLPRWVYYLPFLWSFGAEMTDAAGTTWRMTGPQAEAAWTFYHDLAVGDRVCPRDDEVPQIFQDTGFLTGRVGMCVNGPWFQPFLDQTRLAGRYVVRPIPRGPDGRRMTRVTWDGIAMRAGLAEERSASARRFVRHLLSLPTQDSIGRSGRAVPALRDALPAYTENGTDERRSAFVGALSWSRIQPTFPAFGAVDRAINAHVYRFVQRGPGASAREFLDELSRDPAIVRAFPGTVRTP